jgi:predicted Zn-dependent protease with MMP-like domain
MATPSERRLPPTGRRRPGPTRDRHGRGLRGPISTTAIPRTRTRAERFDELVVDAMEDLEARWHDRIGNVELAVEDVPPPEPVDELDPIPLARLDEDETGSIRLVVHRWPIELRATDESELASLVRDVVVEQIAELLGIEPEELDPEYGIDDE